MSGTDKWIKNKDKKQILNDLVGTAVPGSPVHEQQKMAIFVKCTEDLEKVIKSLNKRITLLDKILKLATLVATIATILGGISTFSNLFK